MKSEAMPPHVGAIFYDYIGLPQRRSLERLAVSYRSRGYGPAIATLKRWSSRYDWQTLAAQHDRVVVLEMDRDFSARRAQKITSDIQAIEAAKERFYDRVMIDPNDPSLTPAQRRRALKPTLSDFRRLLKLEQTLLMSLPQHYENKKPGGKMELTPDEFEVVMKALVRYRHGLPC